MNLTESSQGQKGIQQPYDQALQTSCASIG